MSEKMKKRRQLFWLALALISPWMLIFFFVIAIATRKGWFIWPGLILVMLMISLCGISGGCALPQEQRRGGLARVAFWWNILCLIFPPLLAGMMLYGGSSAQVMESFLCLFFGAYLLAVLLTVFQSLVLRQPGLLITFAAQCIFFGVIYYWLVSDMPTHPILGAPYQFIHYIFKCFT